MPKALIVEDNESAVNGMRIALVRDGWDVVITGDGGRAFELAANADFDIYVLDYRIPTIDGLLLTEKIRVLKSKRLIPVPVVIVTNYPNGDVTNLKSKLKINKVMPKPISLAIFAMVIRRIYEQDQKDLGELLRLEQLRNTPVTGT